MVNNLNYRLLASAACTLRATGRDGLAIENGPVYDLQLAKVLLESHGLFVINDDARRDQARDFSPEMTDAEIASFIMALTPEDRQPSERCKTSNGITIDADGYAMNWDRRRLRRWSPGAKIYIKFGFSSSNNAKLLVLSIHVSKH